MMRIARKTRHVAFAEGEAKGERGDLLKVSVRKAPEQVSVLIADDDPQIRLLIRRSLLPDSRFSVVAEADDGVHAIELASALTPDVIVLDLAMPRIDGLTAIPRLRGWAPDSKIIVLSGFAPFFDNAEKARELGVDLVLSKSSRPGRLRKAILKAASSPKRETA